jgi:NMD protein affecting ribosome stability and mRNA decay
MICQLTEAKKILKENSKTLKNINFGNGISYAFRKRSLVENDGRLVSINIWSKKNLSLSQATAYLKRTRKYFESNDFKTVYAQENWSDPVIVKKNLPCIRFVDPDKRVVIEMDPRGQGSVFNVFITFYNYQWFLRKAKGEE